MPLIQDSYLNYTYAGQLHALIVLKVGGVGSGGGASTGPITSTAICVTLISGLLEPNTSTAF
jgi:hypothetical protein